MINKLKVDIWQWPTAEVGTFKVPHIAYQLHESRR